MATADGRRRLTFLISFSRQVRYYQECSDWHVLKPGSIADVIISVDCSALEREKLELMLKFNTNLYVRAPHEDGVDCTSDGVGRRLTFTVQSSSDVKYLDEESSLSRIDLVISNNITAYERQEIEQMVQTNSGLYIRKSDLDEVLSGPPPPPEAVLTGPSPGTVLTGVTETGMRGPAWARARDLGIAMFIGVAIGILFGHSCGGVLLGRWGIILALSIPPLMVLGKVFNPLVANLFGNNAGARRFRWIGF